MAVSHIFTSPVADFTGTVTVFDSNGQTATTNATALVRPSNWNSVHNQFMTISGNTAGASTASGTNLVLQGGNNVTLSVTDQTIIFSASQSQSVQTQGMVSVQGSTGAITFVNSNGITFGGNASTITASHNGLTSQSVQTQSNVQGISAGTQVGRTGDIVLSDSNGISFGMSGSTRITASYTVPSTAGLLSNIKISAGTLSNNLSALTFADSNGISFGLNGSVITGSHNALTSQSNQAASNSAGSFTFQTLNFSNANNVTFGTSAGGIITASVAPAGAATLTVYAVSNTTQSTSGTIAGSVLSFQGNGGVSAGVSNGSVVISGPDLTSLSVTGALSASSNGSTISLGVGTVTMSATGNTTQASSGTVNLNGLIMQGTGGVSVGVSNGSIVISGNTAGGAAFSAGISGGNTSGDTGTRSNQVVFAGGNNVTLSGSTNAGGMTVTISGANAGGAQTGISGIIVSDATYSSGTVSFSNQANITIGSSVNGATQYIRLSGNPAQTNVAFSADASSTFQTLTFQNSNNVSFSNNAGAIRITHNLAGTSTGTAGNNIGLSMTLNSSGLNLSATVAAQTNQTIGLYGSSQTIGSASSGTLDARSISIIGAGIISVGLHSTSVGGTTTGFLISATQSNQAFSAGAASSTFQTLTFQDSNGISFSNNAGAIRLTHGLAGTGTSVTGLASITLDSAGIKFNGTGLAGTGTTFAGANISASMTMNSAGLNLSASVAAPGGGGFTGGMSNIGNTAGTSGTIQSQMLVVGGPNITVSQSINGNSATLSISGNAPGAAAENNWINLLGANTAGNTTASGSTIGWSGSNITLSGTNGSQIVISAPATSSLVGWRGVEVSTNGSTISVGNVIASYFGNMEGEWPNSTTMQMLQSTSHIQPFMMDYPLSMAFVRIPMSLSNAPSSTAATTGNSSWSYGHSRSHNFVLYSRGTGASSLSLQSVASTQLTDQQSMRVSANANSTQFSYTNRATYQMSTGAVGYTYDYSSSAASLNFHTSNMTAATGLKMMEFPWAVSLTPGQYWLMYGVSSATASQHTNQGTRWFNVMSNYGMSQPNLQFGTIGDATQNSVGPYFANGSFTTAGGGTTASLGVSAVTTSGSHNKMFFQFVRIA